MYNRLLKSEYISRLMLTFSMSISTLFLKFSNVGETCSPLEIFKNICRILIVFSRPYTVITITRLSGDTAV